MFYKEYILNLRDYARKVYSGKWINKIRENDIVLVDVQDKPRIFWKMGRVKKLHFGDDGNVRSVLLQMPPFRDVVYSIDKLVPLEIQPYTMAVPCLRIRKIQKIRLSIPTRQKLQRIL